MTLLLFSCSVVSNSLQPHGLQQAWLSCPSLSSRVCSSSCPFSQWCHSTISSSVIPFSSCLQSFPASGSFQMSQLFASGGQRTGGSSSASVLPMNSQGWFPFRIDSLVVWSPCYLRDSQESSPAPQFDNINEMAALLLEMKVFIATICLELCRGTELNFLHYLI